jgi:hypothetical protein
MLNLRVIQRFDPSGEDLVYTIEDVVPDTQRMGGHIYPFVTHGPYGLLYGGTLDQLRERVALIAAALEQPPLVLEPERLVPAKLRSK